MNLKIGILIIGSLLWREGMGRQAWRDKRLNLNGVVPVKAPICYGRLSGMQGQPKSYTMIFTNGEPNGTAKVVPCQSPVLTCSHLLDEATALWAVESNRDEGEVLSRWGAVGLLKNPRREVPQELLDSWAHKVSTGKEYDSFVDELEKRVPWSEEGLLQLSWPNQVGGDEPIPVDFDLLLATATVPTLGDLRSYASAEQIARAWINHHIDGPLYFNKNREHRITTADDEQIAKILAERCTNEAEHAAHEPACFRNH